MLEGSIAYLGIANNQYIAVRARLFPNSAKRSSAKEVQLKKFG
jgi:hypothetical protein